MNLERHWKECGFILSKAARILQSFSLAKDEVFHCDLLKEKQKPSVPLPLLNLVLLILDRESGFDDLSTNSISITVNLVQLLRFNAVKTKQHLDVFARHSKAIKPSLPVKVGLTVYSRTGNAGPNLEN